MHLRYRRRLRDDPDKDFAFELNFDPNRSKLRSDMPAKRHQVIFRKEHRDD